MNVRNLTVACLLLVFATLSYSAAWTKSSTFDENAHLSNGFIFWDTADFRLIPEAILLQRTLALPVYLAGFQGPDYAAEASVEPPGDWYIGNDWNLAEKFFYDPQIGNDADTLLRIGRATNVVLALCLGLLVYHWSKSLFGETGGLVSLLLFTFSPTLLANSSLITMDLGATAFFAASVWALWKLLHRCTPATVLLSTLAMGGLFVTKLTAVLIIPVGLLMVAVRLIGGPPLHIQFPAFERQVSARSTQLMIYLGLIVVHVLVAWMIIWSMFNFRFSIVEEGVPVTPDRTWQVFSLSLEDGIAEPWKRDAIRIVHRFRLLPEAYLMAAAHTVTFTSEKSSFLNGQESTSGFRSFFPFSVLVKTPLPLLAIVVLAALATLMHSVPEQRVTTKRHSMRRAVRQKFADRIKPGVYASSPLWIWLAVYWYVAIQSSFNIGHRHILPVYPATMILGGAAGVWLRRPEPSDTEPVSSGMRRLLWGVMVLLISWLVLECLLAWPNYLAYFNRLIGGPRNAYRHLVDSSLDWGQDLPALKKWLDQNGLQDPDSPPVYLSYFGSASHEYYGIEARELQHPGPGYQFIDAEPGARWSGGIYCISATALQTGVSTSFGRWSPQDEEAYQTNRGIVGFIESAKESRSMEELHLYLGRQAAQDDQLVERYLGLPPAEPLSNDQLREVGRMFREEAYAEFDKSRFGRLVAYLRQREPDHQVNYSIMIYMLSDEDVRTALLGPPPELVASGGAGRGAARVAGRSEPAREPELTANRFCKIGGAYWSANMNTTKTFRADETS